jgi:hypothetical protein
MGNYIRDYSTLVTTSIASSASLKKNGSLSKKSLIKGKFHLERFRRKLDSNRIHVAKPCLASVNFQSNEADKQIGETPMYLEEDLLVYYAAGTAEVR